MTAAKPSVHPGTIYTPQRNELLVVRGSHDGKTTEWAVSVDTVLWLPSQQPYAVRIDGRVIGSDFNDMLDARIKNQRASIDRLLEHLKQHCPQLLNPGVSCPHMEGK